MPRISASFLPARFPAPQIPDPHERLDETLNIEDLCGKLSLTQAAEAFRLADIALVGPARARCLARAMALSLFAWMIRAIPSTTLTAMATSSCSRALLRSWHLSALDDRNPKLRDHRQWRRAAFARAVARIRRYTTWIIISVASASSAPARGNCRGWLESFHGAHLRPLISSAQAWAIRAAPSTACSGSTTCRPHDHLPRAFAFERGYHRAALRRAEALAAALRSG